MRKLSVRTLVGILFAIRPLYQLPFFPHILPYLIALDIKDHKNSIGIAVCVGSLPFFLPVFVVEDKGPVCLFF